MIHANHTRQRGKTSWALAIALATLGTQALCAGAAPEVQLTNGRISGVARHGAYEYRGVPYAAAPVGDLRWAAPVPAADWQGVRDGSVFGPACPQQARFNLTEGSLNEDCLSLNVSVPADRKPGEKLPVLFWVHGGAFVGGSSNLYRLDILARQGRVAVVSVNYRLGALGFLAHPGFEDGKRQNGNYGLADQRLAMAWVQKNIAAFGGDPRKVTIAGESAGAGSVCMHLASGDKVKGLFSQAIVQSAGCLQPMKTITHAQDTGRALAQALQCQGSDREVAQCLRDKPLQDILVQQGLYADSHSHDFIPFAPVTGTAEQPNDTLPRTVRQALDEGSFAPVPLMVGGTRHEVRLYVGYFWQDAQAGRAPALDPAHFAGWVKNFYGEERTPAIVQRYTPAGGFATTQAVPETLGRMLSDYSPSIGINNCLYLHTSEQVRQSFARHGRKLPVYQWEFADEAAPVLGVGIAKPYPDFAMGSVHSTELNYLFPRLSNTSRIDAAELAPASQQLADQMVAQWAQFVRSGNPNAKGLPAWPRFSGGKTVMLLAPGASAAYDAHEQHQCDFWRSQFKLP